MNYKHIKTIIDLVCHFLYFPYKRVCSWKFMVRPWRLEGEGLRISCGMADLFVHPVINPWEEKKCHFEAMEEGVFTLSPIKITILYLMKVCFTGKISSVEQPATWGKI